MKVFEIMTPASLDKDYTFAWDNDRVGFATIANGKEVGFFPAKSKFDRSGAQEQARKLAVKLRNEVLQADRERREHEYQYVKPLSQLEQEWAALHKRFMSLNDKELERWKQLGQVVRRSLHDETHPIFKE